MFANQVHRVFPHELALGMHILQNITKLPLH